MRSIIVVFAALVGATFDGNVPIDEDTQKYLTEENIREIESGEILLFKTRGEDEDGESRGGGLAIGLIDAPPATVWKILRKYEQHHEFMPHLRRTDVYMREDNRLGLDCTIKVMWKEIDYHVLQTFDNDTLTLSWHLD